MADSIFLDEPPVPSSAPSYPVFVAVILIMDTLFTGLRGLYVLLFLWIIVLHGDPADGPPPNERFAILFYNWTTALLVVVSVVADAGMLRRWRPAAYVGLARLVPLLICVSFELSGAIQQLTRDADPDVPAAHEWIDRLALLVLTLMRIGWHALYTVVCILYLRWMNTSQSQTPTA